MNLSDWSFWIVLGAVCLLAAGVCIVVNVAIALANSINTEMRQCTDYDCGCTPDETDDHPGG